MAEFMVQIELEMPADMPAETLDALKRAEAARALELAASGTLLRLWRVPTRWANWGLWAADDEASLRSILDDLPLRALMTIIIHPVIEHPSDPARHSDTARMDQP